MSRIRFSRKIVQCNLIYTHVRMYACMQCAITKYNCILFYSRMLQNKLRCNIVQYNISQLILLNAIRYNTTYIIINRVQ